MNPLLRLLPALYTRLSGLEVAGEAVPVYQHLDKPTAGHYVLIENARATKGPGMSGCLQWSCTAQITVITQFIQKRRVSSVPANTIADVITTLLDDKRLDLSEYDCQPARLELNDELPRDLTELVKVRRVLRYRWEVYYHGPPVTLPPVLLGGFDYAFIGGAFPLSP